MPRWVAAVRVAFVVLGVGLAGATVVELSSMPPPPPGSDGFAHGMAALFGGILVVLGLGLAAVGVSLPALLGKADRFGFTRWQRRALKGAGLTIGVGLAVGLAVGLVVGLQYGFVLWLLLVVLAVCVVVATLAWRLTTVLVGTLVRVVGDNAP